MAISKMKLTADLGEKFKTVVKGSHELIIDQPVPMGGDGLGLNPLEVFLSSIAGCIVAIGRIISNQRKLNIRSMHVDVYGEIDKDFLLGATTEGRAGFTNLTAKVKIDADMTLEEKQNLLHEIEMRCPIADNIMNTSNVNCEVVE